MYTIRQEFFIFWRYYEEYIWNKGNACYQNKPIKLCDIFHDWFISMSFAWKVLLFVVIQWEISMVQEKRIYVKQNDWKLGAQWLGNIKLIWTLITITNNIKYNWYFLNHNKRYTPKVIQIWIPINTIFWLACIMSHSIQNRPKFYL